MISKAFSATVKAEKALEAFADDKLKIITMTIYLFDTVDNTVGKGENVGYQHVLFFPLCSTAFFFRVLKSWDCVVKG